MVLGVGSYGRRGESGARVTIGESRVKRNKTQVIPLTKTIDGRTSTMLNRWWVVPAACVRGGNFALIAPGS